MSRGFWGTGIALAFVFAWVGFIVFYVCQGSHSFFELELHEFGGFMAGITAVPTLVWVIWGLLTQQKALTGQIEQTRKMFQQEKEERLRRARPSFEDVSVPNIFKGEDNDGLVDIPNSGGTANAIKIDENEFMSTEMKRVVSGSTLTLKVDKKLFKGEEFLGQKQSTRISYEDDYGNRYTKTIVFFYERPEGVRYMKIIFEECEDN